MRPALVRFRFELVARGQQTPLPDRKLENMQEMSVIMSTYGMRIEQIREGSLDLAGWRGQRKYLPL